MTEGSWAKDDIRRAFVAGAKWWEFHSTGGTMWQSDQRLAETEASNRYAPEPDGKKHNKHYSKKNCTCFQCRNYGA